jgi:pSer/pThr/pTyr-binding forkhead associated (FHA) protein
MSHPSDEPERPAAALLVRTGARAGTRFPIVGEETLIGRSPAMDITLTDEGVSREHALLSFDPASGAFAVEDLQSTNGTRVNGKRVRSSGLEPGDELQIGSTRITFERT